MPAGNYPRQTGGACYKTIKVKEIYVRQNEQWLRTLATEKQKETQGCLSVVFR